jgi:hemolysin activation/secretion protein
MYLPILSIFPELSASSVVGSFYPKHQQPDNRSQNGARQHQSEDQRPEETIPPSDQSDQEKEKKSEAKPRQRSEPGGHEEVIPIACAKVSAQSTTAHSRACGGQKLLSPASGLPGRVVERQFQVMPGIILSER